MPARVRRASERVFVPLTIGGGVRDYDAADGTRVRALDDYARADAARWIPHRAGIGQGTVDACNCQLLAACNG